MTSSKGSSSSIFKYYRLDGNKATIILKTCSRCGKGVFMSKHKNRNTCGKCGLTEFH